MSQLGEMVQRRVFQCQGLWTTSWLGVGGAGALDTDEKLSPPMGLDLLVVPEPVGEGLKPSVSSAKSIISPPLEPGKLSLIAHFSAKSGD